MRLLSDLPPLLYNASVVECLFTRPHMSSCKPCIGNSDECCCFFNLRSLKDGAFWDVTGKVSTLISIIHVCKLICCAMFLGKSVVANMEIKIPSIPIIRHSKCELLSNSITERCTEYIPYQDILCTSCSKQAHQMTPHSGPSSCVNYCYQSKTKLRETMCNA